MQSTVKQKLSQYIFFVSIFVFIIFGVHIAISYVYYDAKSSPKQGGVISEALISSKPLTLNPLKNTAYPNAYINHILYRSLLSYDLDTGNFKSDLASCDVSNLAYIECYLEKNTQWSDGSDITVDDVIATINLLQKTDINPVMKGQLANTVIEKDEGKIIFSNDTKDINFLNVFLQPILSKRDIDTLGSDSLHGSLANKDVLYSGHYILGDISGDNTSGVTNYTLIKNNNYPKNPTYIEKIIMQVYPDEKTLIKNKSSSSIIYDKNDIIGKSVSRLDPHYFTLPQYSAVFVNAESIQDVQTRKKILSLVNRPNIIDHIGEEKVRPVYDIFIRDTTKSGKTEEVDMQRLADNAASLLPEGYYSKDELLDSIGTKPTQSVEVVQEKPVKTQKQLQSPKYVQETLEYVNSPYSDKYNFVTKDDILVKGSVPEGTTAVYINDYKLSGYSQGDGTFYYRLSRAYDTIEVGENKYTVYYEIAGEKQEADTFFYFYNPEAQSAKAMSDEFFSQTITKTIETSQIEENNQQQEKSEKVSKLTDLSEKELKSLDENLKYNAQGETFGYTLIYPISEKELELTANIIKEDFAKYGIDIRLNPLSVSDIITGLQEDTLTYDLILGGVNLGHFSGNVYPYFHSTQVKNGYNFSNYGDLSIDIPLEKIKQNNLGADELADTQSKILKLIDDKGLVKSIYSPKHALLIDTDIKNFEVAEKIPDSIYRYDPLVHSYKNEERELNLENKGVGGFIAYLFRSLSN